MIPETLPYSLRMDDGVMVLLFACFFLASYVLSRSRKFLVQLGKDYLLNRERTSIFATSTAADMRCLMLLILQTCVLGGICIFAASVRVAPRLVEQQLFSPLALLGIYVAGVILYLLVKWALYSLLGWIFFDSNRAGLWIESYSTLLYYLGFALFPLALLLVCLDWNLQIAFIWALLLAVSTKILMLFKWIKLFCDNLHGCFLLILYFCTLEIVPCLILYKVLLEFNEYLTIKI